MKNTQLPSKIHHLANSKAFTLCLLLGLLAKQSLAVSGSITSKNAAISVDSDDWAIRQIMPMLAIRYKTTGSPSSLGGFCSAVVIGDKYILTARHCINIAFSPLKPETYNTPFTIRQSELQLAFPKTTSIHKISLPGLDMVDGFEHLFLNPDLQEYFQPSFADVSIRTDIATIEFVPRSYDRAIDKDHHKIATDLAIIKLNATIPHVDWYANSHPNSSLSSTKNSDHIYGWSSDYNSKTTEANPGYLQYAQLENPSIENGLIHLNNIICKGDSGGPLLNKDTIGISLLGIASYMTRNDQIKDQTCGTATYIDIGKYHQWIEAVKDNQNPKDSICTLNTLCTPPF